MSFQKMPTSGFRQKKGAGGKDYLPPTSRLRSACKPAHAAARAEGPGCPRKGGKLPPGSPGWGSRNPPISPSEGRS